MSKPTERRRKRGGGGAADRGGIRIRTRTRKETERAQQINLEWARWRMSNE